MMYNMDNNVRGGPCGKKEEAIPMARKWLSGALAFAMIFGCSAPVALADETPVEVVEVEQDSLEGVEQYASYFPSIDDVTVEFGDSEETKEVSVVVNGDLPETTTIDGAPTAAGLSEFDYDPVTHKLTFTATKDHLTTDGVKVEVQFRTTVTDGTDYYQKVSFTVKKAKDAVEYDKLHIGDVTFDGTKNKFGATVDKDLELTVGVKKVIKVYVDGSEEGEATGLDIKMQTGADKYFSYTTKDITDDDDNVIGNEITVTPVAATSDKYSLLIGARLDSGTVMSYVDYAVTVEDDTAIELLQLRSDVTNIAAGESAIIAPVAYGTDKYGTLKQIDNPNITWTVNGEAMKDSYTDILGNKVTFTKNSNSTVTVKAEGDYVGTFEIGIAPVSGSASGDTVTINVTGSKLPDTVWVDIVDKNGDIAFGEGYNQHTLLPGQSVNLADKAYTVFDGKEDEPYGDNTKYIGSIENYNATVKVKFQDDSKATIEKIAEIDENGVLTIKDNDSMAALLKQNNGKYQFKMDAVITIPASQMASGEKLEMGYEYTITVMSEADDPTMIVGSVDGKESAEGYYYEYEDTEGNSYKGYVVGEANVLTYIGKPVTFTASVKDGNGFTDGIDQLVIWYLEKVNPSEDINVDDYATIDGNVVTTKQVSVDKVKVVGISTVNTNLRVEFKLLATNDPSATQIPVVTPEPSPTAAPSPTNEPTTTPEPSPTAPATQAGEVYNVSSNLNIRSAAHTSSTIVTKVKNGTKLTILGEENDFYKVQLADGTIGYASKGYVRPITETPEDPTGAYAIVTTKGGRLNMRQTAGGTIITTIANGTRVDVIRQGADWTLIEYNGRQGYVSTDYLTIYPNAVG